eukprot:scaffold49123_cov56-Phaeocystis_antarctica.AAC.3
MLARLGPASLLALLGLGLGRCGVGARLVRRGRVAHAATAFAFARGGRSGHQRQRDAPLGRRL